MKESKEFFYMLSAGILVLGVMYSCANRNPERDCKDLCASQNKKLTHYKYENVLVLDCWCASKNNSRNPIIEP